jgi:diguanylate cyclase (GGDEF)-like protein
MRADEVRHDPALPDSRSALEEWVRQHLALPADVEAELLRAFDAVLARQQRLWQESKEEAIHALSTGFADKLAGLRTELLARETTVSTISKYFEDLVGDLTEKSHRDPKTKLMNFDWFMSQLESFLEIEQRVRWSAVGLVDIHDFKSYNDTLGHPVGDRIIEQVAQLLREQIRSDDLIAQERSLLKRPDLHARFGGDEFCFLIPALGSDRQAYAVADRFRGAVERYDWRSVEPHLCTQPVRVDVGVVCLWMGSAGERRFAAKELAAQLVDQADKLMYEAKGDPSGPVYVMRMQIKEGQLREYAVAA